MPVFPQERQEREGKCDPTYHVARAAGFAETQGSHARVGYQN